jgi:hypothetical protein
MNTKEQAIFLDAISEVAKLINSTQAAAARAQSQCHAEIYEHVDIIAKRLYELRVRSEWLRHAVLAGWQLEDAQALNRHGPDRRQSVDRRIENMKKQMTGDLGPDLARHVHTKAEL